MTTTSSRTRIAADLRPARRRGRRGGAFPAVAWPAWRRRPAPTRFGELPTELTRDAAPQISYVYASDDKTLLATFYDENRRDVPLAEIPPVMQKAIHRAAEDQKFYEHNGVDLQGHRAGVRGQPAAGAVQQGASTLTMQYVRQAISYSATSPAGGGRATEDTNARKPRDQAGARAREASPRTRSSSAT